MHTGTSCSTQDPRRNNSYECKSYSYRTRINERLPLNTRNANSGLLGLLGPLTRTSRIPTCTRVSVTAALAFSD